MRSEIALAENPTSSCNLESFPISSAFPARAARPGVASYCHDVMDRSWSPLKPLLAGLVLTLLQLVMAVCLLAPDGPASYRYSTLIQADSYWFMNIVDRGYHTIVPLIDHKAMEVSNVAFFPAYPTIAALFHYGLNIDTGTALLIVAQLAAWGFWSYFFLFCTRWNISPALQICGALLILAHPAAFFLIAGYSESLFLMSLLGFIYCQWRLGHWDIYMLTQAAGWGIIPDYFAVFSPSSYRWLIPALDNPTEASQMSMTLRGMLFVAIAFCELLPAIRRRTGWATP